MSFTLASYQAARDSMWQELSFTKASITTIAGRWYSTWIGVGDPAAASTPTTVAACTSATAGALGWLTATEYARDSSGVRRIVKFACEFATTPNAGIACVSDRVWQIGTLDSTVTGAVTVSSSASARYAVDGPSKGIMAAAEIYTQIGSTATTMNLSSYTDQHGTAGNVGPLTTFGGTGFREVQRLIHLPLVAPNTGCRAVSTVTLTASTLTAGNYGITGFKPLVMVPVEFDTGPAFMEKEAEGLAYFMPQVVAGACLFLSVMATSTSTGIIQGKVTLGEE